MSDMRDYTVTFTVDQDPRSVFKLRSSDGGTEVTFTHRGLRPEIECYDQCSSAWAALVAGNFKNYILSGETQAAPF